MSTKWKNLLIYGVVGVVITFGARALWNEDTKMLIAPFLIVSIIALAYGASKRFFE